ncbi:MAG: FliM/FliN family flagellar motor switch protein [Capsulimonadaceae bacterium]|nr:FliM/FliN family flagellar motor switch protein [Capsulimonadaceae bacterium]
MSKVLSQAEIEALLVDITHEHSGLVEPSAPAPKKINRQVHPVNLPRVGSTAGKIISSIDRRKATQGRRPSAFTYESYDFRRPDKLSKDQLRTIQMIHESFARMFSSSISGYLRSQVQVDLISVEQIAYEEYIKSLTSSLVNVLNVSPLNGQMLFDIDLDILFVMLERLLGGSGEGNIKTRKALTDIEKVLSTNTVRVALTDLTTAWENVVRLQYAVVSLDTSAQFVQIVPNNDTVVLVLMELRVGEHQGSMSFCIPYLLLKPVLAKLNAQHWFTSKVKKVSADMGPRLAARLRETARVPCVARLGVSRVTVDTLANLKVGQMLPLTATAKSREHEAAEGQTTLGTAEIIIGNHVKFKGRIGLRGKRRLAVMVDEVMPPVQELVSFKDGN